MIIPLLTNFYFPVSYTHLDVYKRQQVRDRKAIISDWDSKEGFCRGQDSVISCSTRDDDHDHDEVDCCVATGMQTKHNKIKNWSME